MCGADGAMVAEGPDGFGSGNPDVCLGGVAEGSFERHMVRALVLDEYFGLVVGHRGRDVDPAWCEGAAATWQVRLPHLEAVCLGAVNGVLHVGVAPHPLHKRRPLEREEPRELAPDGLGAAKQDRGHELPVTWQVHRLPRYELPGFGANCPKSQKVLELPFSQARARSGYVRGYAEILRRRGRAVESASAILTMNAPSKPSGG